jgi:hypothetical protein
LYIFFTSKQPDKEPVGKNMENQHIGRTEHCLYYIHKGVSFFVFERRTIMNWRKISEGLYNNLICISSKLMKS